MVDETAGVVGESQRVLKVVVVTGGVGWLWLLGWDCWWVFFSEAQEDGFFQKLSTFTKKGTLGKGWTFVKKSLKVSHLFFLG